MKSSKSANKYNALMIEKNKNIKTNTVEIKARKNKSVKTNTIHFNCSI